MGQQIQDGKNLEYSSFYFFKGEAGVGWEMKVLKFGQKTKFQKDSFLDFFDWFFERFFHWIEKHSIWGI